MEVVIGLLITIVLILVIAKSFKKTNAGVKTERKKRCKGL